MSDVFDCSAESARKILNGYAWGTERPAEEVVYIDREEVDNANQFYNPGEVSTGRTFRNFIHQIMTPILESMTKYTKCYMSDIIYDILHVFESRTETGFVFGILEMGIDGGTFAESHYRNYEYSAYCELFALTLEEDGIHLLKVHIKDAEDRDEVLKAAYDHIREASEALSGLFATA